MNTFATNVNTKYQSGAALIVALILLVALSLMAISSMNTASLDLVMAGNEQYRSRAFVAAEAGIESALAGGTFSSASDEGSGGTVPGTNITTGGNTFAFTITRPNNGNYDPAPPGNSAGQYASIYFRIASTGTSERGSTAATTQELFQVVPNLGGEINYEADACAGTDALADSSAGC
jgi:type IV pilus assembly protein PilX